MVDRLWCVCVCVRVMRAHRRRGISHSGSMLPSQLWPFHTPVLLIEISQRHYVTRALQRAHNNTPTNGTRARRERGGGARGGFLHHRRPGHMTRFIYRWIMRCCFFFFHPSLQTYGRVQQSFRFSRKVKTPAGSCKQRVNSVVLHGFKESLSLNTCADTCIIRHLWKPREDLPFLSATC